MLYDVMAIRAYHKSSGSRTAHPQQQYADATKVRGQRSGFVEDAAPRCCYGMDGDGDVYEGGMQ